MRVDLLDYALAPESVAQTPAADPLDALVLHLPREGSVGHLHVRDLAGLIPEGAVVVVNDTRVLRARLLGHKVGSGGRAELLLVRRIATREGPTERWLALGKASKGLGPGTVVDCGSLQVRVVERQEALLAVELSATDGHVRHAIEQVGHVPLPPYIRRADELEDRTRYQTVFARVDGAVAAPTAGLHLTRELLDQIERRATLASVTLHVGLGTFQPVTVADLDDHAMHAEWMEVPEATAIAIADARARKAPVVAVGTTVVRALESSADASRPGHVLPGARDTRLLVQPGYRFQVVDHLFTNFHVPRSTLLALVAAFAGTSRILSAYAAAQAAGYRFLSYGDAMFIDAARSCDSA